MQFLSIDSNTTLSQLNNRIGTRSVDSVLQLNSLPRVHNIGKAFDDMSNDIAQSYTEVDADGRVSHEVSYKRKINLLNTLTSDEDVFEVASLQDESGWKLLSNVGTLANYLRIPSTLVLADGADILGGTGVSINKTVYYKAMQYLNAGQNIDPVIFNTYSDRQGTTNTGNVVASALQWFKIPWGEVTLYSSLSGESMDFPVYPEQYEDERHANYDTMPELLYQYEPWQVYKSSGPRSNTYTFKMHRDMFTGDHRDGKCNELIRFCEANCYPYYSGSVVQTSTVTLYIAGKPLITGILTSAKSSYSGPIGLDKFPLYVELNLTITEVSAEPLNYYSIKRKGLIG